MDFLSRPLTNHRTAEKGEVISLAFHYHFHPLHRHLDISRVITAESSPLHIVAGLEPGKRKSLTTKLCALNLVTYTGEILVEKL